MVDGKYKNCYLRLEIIKIIHIDAVSFSFIEKLCVSGCARVADTHTDRDYTRYSHIWFADMTGERNKFITLNCTRMFSSEDPQNKRYNNAIILNSRTLAHPRTHTERDSDAGRKISIPEKIEMMARLYLNFE